MERCNPLTFYYHTEFEMGAVFEHETGKNRKNWTLSAEQDTYVQKYRNVSYLHDVYFSVIGWYTSSVI